MNNILFEDNHLIIINKQPSEIVQGDKTGDASLSDNVKTYISKKLNKKGNVYLGVIHRIDRPTSGAVVFAKTSKALSRLNKMLKNREIKKKYLAVVKNNPAEPEARLINYLRKNEKQNKSYITKKGSENSKRAELYYKLVAKSNGYYLLEVELITGRHHQIRAQLANIGCPVKGDLKYGFERSNKDGSIHLHAREISFDHPVEGKNPVNIVAPVPKNDNLWNYFEEIIE